MRNCVDFFRRVPLWCLFLFIPSVVFADKIFNLSDGATGSKWYRGSSFDSAMKGAGLPGYATYYEANAAKGFHCHLNVFYGGEGYYPDGWKHGDSLSGYLIPISGSSCFRVPSNWNGVYYDGMDLILCAWCYQIPLPNGSMTGWRTKSVRWYEYPTNALPSWVFTNPYVQDLEIITDDPGVNGSTVIGGNFEVVPPLSAGGGDGGGGDGGGVGGEGGSFNNWDWDNEPVWTPDGSVPPDNPDNPDDGELSGYTNVLFSAWTPEKVSLQVGNSSAIRISNESIKNSNSSIDSRLVDLGDNISAYMQKQEDNWDWLKDIDFNFSPQVNVPPPQVNVQPPQVNVAPPQVSVLPPEVNVNVDAPDNSDFLQHLEVIKGSLESDLTDSDFPSIPSPEQSQGEHDADFEADLSDKISGWEIIADEFDRKISDFASGTSGLMSSFVGGWAGIGRELPSMTINVPLSIFDYSFVVDLSPYESIIGFFRAFSSVMMVVGFMFFVYKLLLGIGD